MRQTHLRLLKSKRQVEDYLFNPSMYGTIGVYIDTDKERYYVFQHSTPLDELFDGDNFEPNLAIVTEMTFEQLIEYNKPSPTKT